MASVLKTINNVKHSTVVVLKLNKLLYLVNTQGYYPIEDKKDIDWILEMSDKADLVVSALHDNRLIGIFYGAY